MANFATWLMALIGPLVTRALVSVGIGLVSYGAADTAFNGILDGVRAGFGGISGDLAAFIAMSGFFSAVSAVVGAMLAVMMFKAFSQAALGFVGGK